MHEIAKGSYVVEVPLYVSEHHGTVTGKCHLLKTVSLPGHCWQDRVRKIVMGIIQIVVDSATRFYSVASFGRRLGRVLARKTLLDTA